MLSEAHVDILNEMSILSKLPMSLTDGNGTLLRSFPGSCRPFFRDEYYALLVDTLRQCRAPGGVVILCLRNTFYVAVTEVDDDSFLVTYPVVTTVPADASVNHNHSLTSVRKWIQPELQAEWYQFTLDLPVLSTAYLERLADLAKKVCTGQPSEGACLVYTDDFERFSSCAPVSIAHPMEEVEEDPIPGALPEHDSPYMENRILDAITEGNEERLTQAMRERVKEQIGKMSLNPLRQEKYMFVCFTYAASRAAIKGGLAHETSFRLSDSYCQKMDGLTSPDQIRTLRQDLALDYCRRVAALKGHSGSTLKCCAYIHAHIYEELSVDELAMAVHLNRHSLSDYFKRDMGMSIQDYIIQARLEEARHLLVDSDMSLSTISALLCYSTQSYFCKKFREKYGTTPQKYRSEHRK